MEQQNGFPPVPPTPTQPPVEPKKPNLVPWLIAGILAVVAIGALASGDEPTPVEAADSPTPIAPSPTEEPSPEPSLEPEEEEESFSEADLVRGMMEDTIPLLADVSDADIDELGEGMCQFVRTTDDGSGDLDNVVSEKEVVHVTTVASEELGMTRSLAAQFAGAVVAAYCPEIKPE